MAVDDGERNEREHLLRHAHRTRTTGSPFSAVPFDPNTVIRTPVGTATLSFANGNAGSFSYLYNGVSQTKAIPREIFRNPGTICR